MASDRPFRDCAVLACLLGTIFAYPAIANAQVICGIGQYACGTLCYEPALGQHCDNGIVCGPGQYVCGGSCYTPSQGQRCDQGAVCGPGQMVCAGRCFAPAEGQHCDQGVVCGPGQFACGRSCYTPSAGQHCDQTTTEKKGERKHRERRPGDPPYPSTHRR